MVYGPGFAAALDVVGHEITHGVIRYEADLLFLHEPGAVNEALADIFGTLIEFRAKGGAGNWTIGESLPGRSAALPLRDMASPHLTGAGGASLFRRDRSYDARTNFGQPDYWTEYVRPTDPICRDLPLQDNGCVHFNSGILNKFAHLISEGGTHHGVTVVGIGRAKLGRLAYRTLTHYLYTTSGLQDAAEAFTLSCADLSRADPAGMSAGDCAQVQKAREAVGLDVPTG
jgi:Zn-dependent metalloprotease